MDINKDEILNMEDLVLEIEKFRPLLFKMDWSVKDYENYENEQLIREKINEDSNVIQKIQECYFRGFMEEKRKKQKMHCPLCGLLTKNTGKHLRLHHLKLLSYRPCPFCTSHPKQVGCKWAMHATIQHIKTAHKDVFTKRFSVYEEDNKKAQTLTNVIQQNYCIKCNEFYCSKAALKKHKVVCVNFKRYANFEKTEIENIFVCKLCKTKMHQSRIYVHKYFNDRFDKCNTIFRRKQRLEKHKLICANFKKYAKLGKMKTEKKFICMLCKSKMKRKFSYHHVCLKITKEKRARQKIINERRKKAERKKLKLNCFCGQTDYGIMVQCDTCTQSFHANCVGLSDEECVEISERHWDCPACGKEQ